MIGDNEPVEKNDEWNTKESINFMYLNQMSLFIVYSNLLTVFWMTAYIYMNHLLQIAALFAYLHIYHKCFEKQMLCVTIRILANCWETNVTITLG